MLSETKELFLTQHGKYLSHMDTIKTNHSTEIPFRNHPQFASLTDTLSRKNQHHAVIYTNFSSHLYVPLLEAYLQSIANPHTPYHLQQANLLFLSLENAAISEIKQIAIEKEFETLRASLSEHDKYTIIALTRMDLFGRELKKTDERFLRKQIDMLLAHPQCRIILLAPTKEYAGFKHLSDQFSHLKFPSLTEDDVMALLRRKRMELEQFHRVTIPDDVLAQAYTFAERYLGQSDILDNTLLLLDSSAARAAHLTPNEKTISSLTLPTLIQTLSAWTQIPVSHLPATKITQHEFTQSMQSTIYGQEMAISMIGRELLQAQSRLHQQPGPVCKFLFAGPPHTGKKSVAKTLIEHLFKQPQLMYLVRPTVSLSPIIEVKVHRLHDEFICTLADAIQQTPYGIFYFENIDQASATALDDIREILTTGYLYDDAGNQYNFSQAIIILSTNIDSKIFSDFVSTPLIEDDIYTMDLMQLVMGDHKQDSIDRQQNISPDEVTDKLLPVLLDKLPTSLCQATQIIPFLPLNKPAIEKIIRLQLRKLGKQLEKRYSIELGYAPEVIRFLTNEVLQRREMQNHQINPDTALKTLYFSIEQTLLTQADNHPKQLFLQLNERGQSLRCDWLPSAEREQTPTH